MDSHTLGLYGGLAGGGIGVLGGLVGTVVSIINTHGPRERAFMARCAVAGWAVMAVTLATAFLLPGPFRFVAMVPLFLASPWVIRAGNRRQADLRRDDQVDAGGPDPAPGTAS